MAYTTITNAITSAKMPATPLLPFDILAANPKARDTPDNKIINAITFKPPSNNTSFGMLCNKYKQNININSPAANDVKPVIPFDRDNMANVAIIDINTHLRSSTVSFIFSGSNFFDYP